MANIDNINLLLAGEHLNGTGNEGIGEPDTLNRPLKNLVSLMETGDFDAYATKMNIHNLVDNNEFEATVATDHVVRVEPTDGLYYKAIPDIKSVVGFADLNDVLVQTAGVRTFASQTFTKGYFYYLSKTVPGTIVDMYSADKSALLVGIAVSTTQLYIKIEWDVDSVDNSIPMAIAFS